MEIKTKNTEERREVFLRSLERIVRKWSKRRTTYESIQSVTGLKKKKKKKMFST